MSSPGSVEAWSDVWAASGAAGLSGHPDGPLLDVPVGLVQVATDAAAVIERESRRLGRTVRVDGPALLGERAALAGLRRAGRVSCGGGTRLLRAADGWIAVSLVRDADVEALPAWLEEDAVLVSPEGDVAWHAVAGQVLHRGAHDLVERAALLGVPAARLGETPAATSPDAWQTRLGDAAPLTSVAGRVVVDLSSLWAGPLCAQLLGDAGMRVIKVESTHRPDGARRGPPAVFDLLHAGHEHVALDLRRPQEQRVLAALLTKADVVIEASRPRALAQWGIVAPLPGPRVWLSITGHGRTGAAAVRVGFGDDAAVAGGLVTHDGDGPCFCVDAVADPLTGMVAAGLVLARLASGGRWLLDLALARTAALAGTGPLTHLGTRPIAEPRGRPSRGRAPALGEHTLAVLGGFGIGR